MPEFATGEPKNPVHTYEEAKKVARDFRIQQEAEAMHEVLRDFIKCDTKSLGGLWDALRRGSEHDLPDQTAELNATIEKAEAILERSDK